MSDDRAGDDLGVDIEAVHTLPELATAFDRLRGSRSYGDLDKAVRPRRLAPSTLSNLRNGDAVPTRDTVLLFLTACGLDEHAQKPWLAAWERVSTAHLRRPVGAVRARQARPRLLGVHASIQVEPAATDLPAYVPRDLDADLRTAITVAAEHGGFVLLVGGSSVGKTRALFQVVHAELSEWWLVHPDPTDTHAVAGLAASPSPRTVVWLDELQRYLDTATGLPAAHIRTLVTAGTVLVATLWPHEYDTRTTRPPLGQPDPHANDRELLGLAHVIDVPDAFSPAERRRAETLATDRRIRIALDTPDAGFTQVLAAGPELVRRWENAPDPYGMAVITAALDARRVGATAPLTRDLLAAAAPGYLTDRQQATAPAAWLDQALDYATTTRRGATSALSPVPAGMGQTAGYTVADYLHQHALRVRRTECLPDAVWQALVDHHHPDDATRLVESARLRGRSDEAIELFRPLADAGSAHARRYLAELLADQGRVDELRARTNAGDWDASWHLADALRAQGSIEELRERAESGDVEASYQLDEILTEQGQFDQLRRRADAGDQYARYLLIHHLAGRGHITEAISVLRAWAASTPALNTALAGLFAQRGEVDEAITLLRERAATGEVLATHLLPQLLADHGHIDEAIALLRKPVDDGKRFEAHYLAQMLARFGRVDEAIDVLRKAAPEQANPLTLDHFAAEMLPQLLAEHGRFEELRERADNGDRRSATVLARQLLAEDRLDELRERSIAGDTVAANHLARRIADDGDVDTAIALLRAQVDASNPDSAIGLARLLADHDRVDEAIALLRDHVSSGNYAIAHALIEVLVRHDRVAELREEQAAGTREAAEALSSLERGESWPRHQQQSGDHAPEDSPSRYSLRLSFLFLQPP